MVSFLDALHDLGEKIKEAFSELNHANVPITVSPELRLILTGMKDALREMEFVVIDEKLQNLEALDLGDALKDRIEEIKNAVIMMDYDIAVGQIQKLLD
jgi:hypothetical protein